MKARLLSSYRLMSLVAICATSVLVACGPEQEPLESIAGASFVEEVESTPAPALRSLEPARTPAAVPLS